MLYGKDRAKAKHGRTDTRSMSENLSYNNGLS